MVSKTKPLIASLKKAEVTSRPTPPSIVFGNANGVFKDRHHVSLDYSVLYERILRLDVRLVADVAPTLFVRAYPDIADARIITNELLKGFKLHDSSTPPCMGCRKEVVETLEVVIKVSPTT